MDYFKLGHYPIIFWLYLIYFEKNIRTGINSSNNLKDIYNLFTYRQKFEKLVAEKKEEQERTIRRFNILSGIREFRLDKFSSSEQAYEFLKKIKEAFEVDTCVLYVTGDNSLKLFSSIGLNEKEIKNELPINTRFVKEIISKKKILTIVDSREIPGFKSELEKDLIPYPFISCAGAPLIIGEKVTGVICLLSQKSKKIFADIELEQIQIVAGQLAHAIENTKLFEGNEKHKEILVKQIVARKKAEEAIIESEMKYRSLVEQASDAIMISDRKGNFLDVNTRFCAMFGYDKKELLGTNISMMIDQEQLKTEPMRFEELLNGGHVFSQRRMMHKDGTIITVEANVKMVTDGRILAIARDISDRKTAESKLKESEKKLRQVLSSYSDSFYVVDKNYNVILINEVAKRNMEIAWGKTLQVGTNLLNVIPPESEKQIKENFEKVFNGQKIEYERYNSNKELPAWTLLNFMPVSDDTGAITGAYVVGKDITERKIAEKVIKESEERYRTLVENAPEALVVLDVETRKFINVSESAIMLFKKSKEELLKIGPVEVSPEYQPSGRLSAEASIEKLNEAVNGGKPYFEWTHCDSDGNLIPCEVRLVRLPAEKKILIRGSIIDITERKKAEAELKKFNERFETIARTTNDGLWEWNLETGELWANQMHQHLYGLTPADPVPTEKQWEQKIHPDDRQRIIKTQRDALASNVNVWVSEYRFETKNNNYIDIYDRTYIIRDETGKAVRIMGSMSDITERKKAEAENQLLVQRNLQTINTMLDGFVLTDAYGKIIEVNPAFCKMIGYSLGELKDMESNKITAIFSQKGIEEIIQKTKKRKSLLLETILRKKDKSLIHIEASLAILEFENKLLVTAFVRDITERKATEEKIKSSNEQLRQLTAHLQTIREEERQRIGREIHDELGQQLTAIKMDVAWLEKKVPDQIPVLKNKFQNIIGLLDGSNRSVRRILNELRPSILDEFSLLEAMKWHGKQFTTNTGVPVEIKSDKKLNGITEEIATCIFRVFQEALTNVTKYANAKNVLTTIQMNKDLITITIRDDGVGFDQSILQNKRTFGILGMKERVRALSGELEIESSAGKGTKINFSLPNKL